MTRLKADWIKEIEHGMDQYDEELKKKTGMNLLELASEACGVSLDLLSKSLKSHCAAVIPMASGQGVINGFSQSVAAVLCNMGVRAFVTKDGDVSGIYEAKVRGADLFFMADDSRFIAFNMKTGAMEENNHATAAGYGAALEGMAGPLAGEPVLLLGCGAVGREAYGYLRVHGAVVSVYDKNADRMKILVNEGAKPLEDLGQLKQFGRILDTTDEGGWLHPQMLAEELSIAACGIPLSLDEKARMKHGQRLVHDWLEIGTAVMLANIS